MICISTKVRVKSRKQATVSTHTHAFTASILFPRESVKKSRPKVNWFIFQAAIAKVSRHCTNE